jgi:hypothetical protein
MENNLDYTITEFDRVSKKLTVEFGEDGYAVISLTEPFPETREDLENIIRSFAPTVEEKKAITIEDTKMNYIDSLIGNTQKTKRSTWAEKKGHREPEEEHETIPAIMNTEETIPGAVTLKKIKPKEV